MLRKTISHTEIVLNVLENINITKILTISHYISQITNQMKKKKQK